MDDSYRKITFGKYKGRTVADVMHKDAQYLLWAHNNVKFFDLTVAEEEYAIEIATQQRLDEDEEHELAGYYYDEFWKD